MKGKVIGLDVVGMSGGEELVMCPFHDDTHASASWNPKSDLFYCFTCGIGMGLEQLLKRTGMMIDSDLWYEEEYDKPPPRVDFSVKEKPSWEPGRKGYNEYLQSRGIGRDTCERYGVTVSPDNDEIFFPVVDLGGKTVGRISRYTEARDGPRYRKVGEQMPIWPMDHLVGLKYGEYIVVTEGLFSALRIATIDTRMRALSLAGAKANEGIVAALSAFNPIIIYDNDRAGKGAARKMKMLRPDWSVMIAKTSPDDMHDNNRIHKMIDKILDRIK